MVRIGNAHPFPFDEEETIRYVTHLREQLVFEPVEVQREIIHSFIKRIVVTKEEVVIEYTLPQPNSHVQDEGCFQHGAIWYARQDLNLRPLPPQGSALSPELRAHLGIHLAEGRGFEPRRP